MSEKLSVSKDPSSQESQDVLPPQSPPEAVAPGWPTDAVIMKPQPDYWTVKSSGFGD
jgi:hypothetical protein